MQNNNYTLDISEVEALFYMEQLEKKKTCGKIWIEFDTNTNTKQIRSFDLEGGNFFGRTTFGLFGRKSTREDLLFLLDGLFKKVQQVNAVLYETNIVKCLKNCIHKIISGSDYSGENEMFDGILDLINKYVSNENARHNLKHQLYNETEVGMSRMLKKFANKLPQGVKQFGNSLYNKMTSW